MSIFRVGAGDARDPHEIFLCRTQPTVSVEVSLTGRVKVLTTGDQVIALSLMASRVASSASPASVMLHRTVVNPGTLSSGVSPTPQTAEMSMSPSMATSILLKVTPRVDALASKPTEMHDPSAARAISEGLGAASSPSR